MSTRVLCPYCLKPAALVGGDVIYQHRQDLKFLRFWQCNPCGAHVGCHKPGAYMHTPSGKVISDGTLPLGRLANAALRKAKSAAHDTFDLVWGDEPNPPQARRAAYARLAAELGIPVHECHIGEFDVATCQRVVEIANRWHDEWLQREYPSECRTYPTPTKRRTLSLRRPA